MKELAVLGGQWHLSKFRHYNDCHFELLQQATSEWPEDMSFHFPARGQMVVLEMTREEFPEEVAFDLDFESEFAL